MQKKEGEKLTLFEVIQYFHELNLLPHESFHSSQRHRRLQTDHSFHVTIHCKGINRSLSMPRPRIQFRFLYLHQNHSLYAR